MLYPLPPLAMNPAKRDRREAFELVMDMHDRFPMSSDRLYRLLEAFEEAAAIQRRRAAETAKPTTTP